MAFAFIGEQLPNAGGFPRSSTAGEQQPLVLMQPLLEIHQQVLLLLVLPPAPKFGALLALLNQHKRQLLQGGLAGCREFSKLGCIELQWFTALQLAEQQPLEQWLQDLGFRPPYSVVLVTVESLRADHVGFYGYGKETTPAIDDLAAQSVVFKNAYSVSSAPQTSLSSILSGRYPSELKRNRNFFPLYHGDNIFLAEMLSEQRFHSAAFPSHWYFREGSLYCTISALNYI